LMKSSEGGLEPFMHFIGGLLRSWLLSVAFPRNDAILNGLLEQCIYINLSF